MMIKSYLSKCNIRLTWREAREWPADSRWISSLSSNPDWVGKKDCFLMALQWRMQNLLVVAKSFWLPRKKQPEHWSPQCQACGNRSCHCKLSRRGKSWPVPLLLAWDPCREVTVGRGIRTHDEHISLGHFIYQVLSLQQNFCKGLCDCCLCLYFPFWEWDWVLSTSQIYHRVFGNRGRQCCISAGQGQPKSCCLGKLVCLWCRGGWYSGL